MPNLKDITELPVIDKATDDLFLLANDNGAAKQIPASAVAKVKTVNGVKPDNDGNVRVDTSWNDLKDRPFGVETAEITVNVVERAELPGFRPFAVGDTVTVKVDGVEHILVAFDADVPTIGDNPAVLFDGGSGSYGWAIGYLDGVCMCICPNGCTVSYMGETVKQIDPKYIPGGSGGSGGGHWVMYTDGTITTSDGLYEALEQFFAGGDPVSVTTLCFDDNGPHYDFQIASEIYVNGGDSFQVNGVSGITFFIKKDGNHEYYSD